MYRSHYYDKLRKRDDTETSELVASLSNSVYSIILIKVCRTLQISLGIGNDAKDGKCDRSADCVIVHTYDANVFSSV